jgi:Tol biopolymer transport system component/predicted Ser/Thr protein kinase
MTLAVGTRLGPYEVLAPLGAGGMGEVYRARDTRLGREVAIKVLPAGLAGDDDRRARFEQEARSASALNHPNIVTIHDIGTHDGTLYIAMEMVEGRSLRDLLVGELLPVRRMLDIAVQMTEGLAKAHAAGIVHRDLKPENVMVSKDGFVKILDFGLAKLAEVPAGGQSDLPTVGGRGTQPGVVLGTVGYMSPEQASGESVDFRSDQFSFGSILYEMATGKRAFQKGTGVETLSAIIREEPQPIIQVSPRTPAPLRWIVERCLSKEPDERYASTRDLARDLRSLRDHLSESSAPAEIIAAPVAAVRRRRALLAGAAVGAVILAAGFLAGQWAGGRSVSHPRFQRLTFRRGSILTARFAPGGESVVYGAAWEGNPPEVFTTRPGSPESRSLGLPPADVLAVSASGELAILLDRHYVLGWESRGTLARVPMAGGAPRQVLEDVQDADWSPDGKELAVVREVGDRRRLESPIGRVLYETSGWIDAPRFSPDGRWIAFVDHPQRGDSAGSIAIVDSGGRKRTLTAEHFSTMALSWSPGGNEIWCTWGESLRAVTLSGKERVIASSPGGWTLEDVSRDGRVLFDRRNHRREIVAAIAGTPRQRNLTWLDWSFPTALSDDGKALLFDEQNRETGNYPIYLRQTDGSAATLLGKGGSFDLSPDGRWALAVSFPGRDELVLLPTGPGQPRSFGKAGLKYQWATFFPDGRKILATASEPGRSPRLFVQELSGGKPQPVSPEGVSALYWHAVSPDGRSIAAIGPDGRIAIYPVQPLKPKPVAGIDPGDLLIRWTADGRGLYVWNPSEMPARVSIVDVASGHRAPWKEIFPPDPAGILGLWPILITSDGTSYAYSYRRVLGDLYVAEGLR